MGSDAEALIVVDVQNDFCPGGALEVKDGDSVVAPINAMMDDFHTVVLTQDWHPADHSSFASGHEGKVPFDTVEMSYGTQVLWPDHCVRGSHGAAFHPDLHLDPAHIVIRKGFRRDIDSYSAFFENDRRTPTGLEGYLRARGIHSVTMVGLALDFCVFHSAADAAKLDFQVTVVGEACRGIDLDGSFDRAIAAMSSAGIRLA